jgi:hypothetical protein
MSLSFFPKSLLSSKSIQLFTSACLLSVVSFSCAPKDTKMKPTAGANSGGSGNTVVGAFTKNEINNESNKHLVVFMERAVEAIYIFKAVTEPDFKSENIQIEDIDLDQQKLKKISFSKDLKQTDTTSRTKNSYLVQSILNDKNEVIKLVIKNSSRPTGELSSVEFETESVVKNSSAAESIVLNNFFTEIIISKKSVEGQDLGASEFQVQYVKSDYAKTFNLNQYVLDSKLAFNFKILNPNLNSFQLSKFDVNHYRSGLAQTTNLEMTGDSKDLILTFNAQCASMNGKLSLSSKAQKEQTKDSNKKGPLFKKDLVYSDSSVTIPGKFPLNFPASSCENRPLVDLSRMF